MIGGEEFVFVFCLLSPLWLAPRLSSPLSPCCSTFHRCLFADRIVFYVRRMDELLIYYAAADSLSVPLQITHRLADPSWWDTRHDIIRIIVRCQLRRLTRYGRTTKSKSIFLVDFACEVWHPTADCIQSRGVPFLSRNNSKLVFRFSSNFIEAEFAHEIVNCWIGVS